MTEFRRYGLYMVPQGGLYATGASWLGWDAAAGQVAPQPDVTGLPKPAEVLTATPRKYGLHGTIKPPFRLAEGKTVEELHAAVSLFCETQAPVTIPEMQLRKLGRFIALVPAQPDRALSELAAAVVAAFDPFRAPLNEAELAKRRKSKLSERQEALLQRWGYPYVMDEFRFHITLSGALEPDILDAAHESLADLFAPHIGQPLPVPDLALMGEDEAGFFHLVHRYTLAG